mgnify:CR=1 FL=1
MFPPRDPDVLDMFTVYENPRDAPGLFVVRRHVIGPGGPQPAEGFAFSTLTAARAAIPPGCFCLGRQPTDEPQIVETWV